MIANEPSLLETISAHAASMPTRVAVVHDDTPVTYPALALDVARVATWLHAQGIRAGDPVGITIRDEYRHLLASLALTRLGCVQVCLPSFEPPTSRLRIAERLAVVWHLVEADGQPVPGARALTLPAPHTLRAQDPTLPEARARALIVFSSSGTTGRAKLIPVDQARVFESARLFSSPPDTLALFASLEHNLSKLSTFRMLVWGRTAVLSSVRDRFRLLETCRRFNVTHMTVFAFTAKSLLDEVRDAAGERPLLPGVAVTLSGSRIGVDLIRRFRAEISPKTFVTYGAMEIGLISRASAEHLERDGDSVGHPVPGVSLEIVDEQDQVVPAGTTGRIRIASAACITHYLDDPEATARMFRNGWFYPGDLGMLTEDGMLVFRGRADDMMILNSINIFPAEIERVAETFEGVVDCAAFPMPSALHGQIPMLAVVGNVPLDLDAIARHCRERLGNRSPRRVVQLARLPRNPAGKILRGELATLAAPSNPSPKSS